MRSRWLRLLYKLSCFFSLVKKTRTMNKYWDSGSYTTFTFACIVCTHPGNAELMLHESYIFIYKFYAFFYMNKLHTNNDCTTIKPEKLYYVFTYDKDDRKLFVFSKVNPLWPGSCRCRAVCGIGRDAPRPSESSSPNSQPWSHKKNLFLKNTLFFASCNLQFTGCAQAFRLH